jgi:NAD-dependent deacetylase
VKTDALLPGEGIPADRLAAARDLIVRCDALIVVNPLALSYPAASFPLAAHRLGSLLIEVTPRESQVSGLSDAVVIGQPEIVLPALAERVAAMKLEGASR